MERSTIELLTEYNIDPQNTAIKQYYNADNLWKTLRIERDENKHSAFLAWLFGHDVNSENSPLIKLLNLLVMRSTDEQMDSHLKTAVLKAQLKIKSAAITTEMTVSRLSTLVSNDRLDIYSKCEVDGVEGFSQLEIIIENKVDALEGDEKNKKREKWEKGLSQTQRYYHACHENRKDDSAVQLFVFLTGKEQKPQDGHFITISYQDLVDYILEPYLKNSNVDSHTEMSIKEYLRILGNPYNKNNTILATTMEEKELLKDFYDRNKDLFMRAVDVMIATTTDEDKKADLEKAKGFFNRASGRRHYKINGQGDYFMYQVIEEFAIYVMKTNKTIDYVDKLVKSYTGSRKEFLSKDKDKVKRIKNGKEEYYTFSYDGVDYFGTKEWSGDNDGNFQKLTKGINKNYNDFQIVEI